MNCRFLSLRVWPASLMRLPFLTSEAFLKLLVFGCGASHCWSYALSGACSIRTAKKKNLSFWWCPFLVVLCFLTFKKDRNQGQFHESASTIMLFICTLAVINKSVISDQIFGKWLKLLPTNIFYRLLFLTDQNFYRPTLFTDQYFFMNLYNNQCINFSPIHLFITFLRDGSQYHHNLQWE